jgi:hypothetical protein
MSSQFIWSIILAITLFLVLLRFTIPILLKVCVHKNWAKNLKENLDIGKNFEIPLSEKTKFQSWIEILYIGYLLSLLMLFTIIMMGSIFEITKVIALSSIKTIEKRRQIAYGKNCGVQNGSFILEDNSENNLTSSVH